MAASAEQGAEERIHRPPRPSPEQDLEELLFTLEICRRSLPWNAHPEHYDRLKHIEGMVRWCLTRR